MGEIRDAILTAAGAGLGAIAGKRAFRGATKVRKNLMNEANHSRRLSETATDDFSRKAYGGQADKLMTEAKRIRTHGNVITGAAAVGGGALGYGVSKGRDR